MATLEREKSRINPFLREPDPVHAPIAALERRHSSGDDSHAPAKELAKSTKSGLSEDGTRKLFELYADRQQGPKGHLDRKEHSAKTGAELDSKVPLDNKVPSDGGSEVYTLPGSVNLRAQASASSTLLGQIPAGTAITIEGEVQGVAPSGYTNKTWCKVHLADGRSGYMYGPLIGHSTPTTGDSTSSGTGQPGGATYTLASEVNLRSQASAQSEQVARLAIGTVLTIDEEVEGIAPSGSTDKTWCKVHLADGRQGFVYGPLVGRGTTAATTPPATSTSWAAGDKGFTTYGTNLRAEANSTSSLTSLPGGAGFNVLGVVEGEEVEQNKTWLQVSITYASDAGVIDQTGYLHSSVVYKGDSSSKGKTRDELVGMLGSSMVENGQWSAGNPFAPVFGGPDFFGAGRYGGQCTWFAQAVRGESLPTGNAGYGGWVTDSRVTHTPAAGKAYLTPGHVAIVTSVSGGDGHFTITLAESNWGSPGEITTGRSVSIEHDAEGKTTNGSWFI